MDSVGRLLEIRSRSPHFVIGLISGTSADGVAAALAELDDSGTRLALRTLGHCVEPYPRELAERVLAAAAADAAELADLHARIGEHFALAARAVARAAGRELAQVDLIGSHGQTVYHRPPAAGAIGVTLQLGSAAVLAERTGLPVVSDFRARDMALGGQGAPLVPLLDQRLFARPGEARAILNVGGIANVTAVTERAEDLVAFDTGPGNALMDALVSLGTGGAAPFDENGGRAARGTIDDGLLRDLLAHPFLAAPPPKSADRDTFGRPLARRLLAEHAHLALEDLLATAVAWTAASIAGSIRALPPPFRAIDRVIASGGGTKNAALMRELARRLAPIPLETTDDHGVAGDAKEALAFAVLARETLLGRPGNVPRATGARAAAVLGSLTP